MNLQELVSFKINKKEELKREIMHAAEKIDLEEVLSHIKLTDSQIYYYQIRNFKEGQAIDYIFMEGNYTAHITPEGIMLQSSDIDIKEFKEEKAKEIYRSLSAVILRAIEEYEPPF